MTDFVLTEEIAEALAQAAKKKSRALAACCTSHGRIAKGRGFPV
jgi:hypothetical protein